MAVVYTGGTFDLFHAGHVNFLRQCFKISRMIDVIPLWAGKDYKDYASTKHTRVVVSLNSDSFVKSFKSKPPIYRYEERRELLLGCRYVDEVVENTGEHDSKVAINQVNPEFIIIGSDWAMKDYYRQMGFTQKWLDDKNIQLLYVPYTWGISTSELKGRIVNA